MQRVFIPFLLCAFFWLNSSLSIKDAAMTSDEGYHIVRGLMLLKTGDLRLNQHHPYLFNAISAIPILFDDDIKIIPLSNESWKNGYKDTVTEEMIQLNGGKLMFAEQVLFYPRLFMIFLTTLFIYLFYILLYKEFGFLTAFVATIFFAISPGFTTHAQMITTDAPVAMMTFLGTYSLYKLINKRDSRTKLDYALFLIFTFLAILTKYSAVILGGVSVILLFAFLFAENMRKNQGVLRSAAKPLIISATICITWLLMLTAAYKFEFMTYKEATYIRYEEADPLNIEPSLRAYTDKVDLVDLYRNLKLPFAYYIKGFFENVISKNFYKHETFFFGQYHNIGPEYHVVALLLKEPITLIVAITAGALQVCAVWLARLLKRQPIWSKHLVLYAIPLIIMLTVMQSSIKLGIRHILPIYPFIFLFAGYFIARLITQNKRWLLLVIPSILYMYASVLFAFPHYLGYFNELTLGSKNGYKYLHDSNLDWGRNEREVYEYILNHPEQEILYYADSSYGYNINIDMLQGDRYYIVRLVKAYGDPIRQAQYQLHLRELLDSGDIEPILWIANTHVLVYIESDDLIKK